MGVAIFLKNGLTQPAIHKRSKALT